MGRSFSRNWGLAFSEDTLQRGSKASAWSVMKMVFALAIIL